MSSPSLEDRIATLEKRLDKIALLLRVNAEDIVLIEEGAGDEIEQLKKRVAELEKKYSLVADACEHWYREAQRRNPSYSVAVEKCPYTRDEVIEMAKRDVEELKSYGDWYHIPDPEGKYDSGHLVYAEFIVNRLKRTVVCSLRGINTHNAYARGIAKAHPEDTFNIWLGKAIALRRALGLEVPDYYINAPQPTEVRVGDVVDLLGPSLVMTEYGAEQDTRLLREGKLVVLDDSHDFGGQEVES
jgi:archaellum component FlaC